MSLFYSSRAHTGRAGTSVAEDVTSGGGVFQVVAFAFRNTEHTVTHQLFEDSFEAREVPTATRKIFVVQCDVKPCSIQC